MGKLRKWVAYRIVERPYTRWSKSRKKAFVKSRPGKKVIKFDMGDLVGGPDQFTLKLQLISRDRVQVRANAIEAARITSLRPLEAQLGRAGFYYRIMMHPHHVLRENPLAAGAGADRLSTGMSHAFGKTIGTAAQIEEGKVLLELYLPKEKEALGRLVLNKASKKLPIRTTIKDELRVARILTADELKHKQAVALKMKEQDDAAKAKADAAKAENDAKNKAAAAPAKKVAAPAKK